MWRFVLKFKPYVWLNRTVKGWSWITDKYYKVFVEIYDNHALNLKQRTIFHDMHLKKFSGKSLNFNLLKHRELLSVLQDRISCRGFSAQCINKFFRIFAMQLVCWPVFTGSIKIIKINFFETLHGYSILLYWFLVDL